MTNQNDESTPKQKIIVRRNGPYTVFGDVPLVHKTQVVTEFGEPIAWEKDATIPTEANSFNHAYDLCRCGHSKNKPFCDSTHRKIVFDGSETADTGATEQRRVQYGPGGKIFVRQDASLCINSGFCGNRFTNIPRMAQNADDTQIRSLMIAMAERCPSGSYTYSFEENGPDVEPDLPKQVAVTTEMTDQGPIMGALWVTGYIPIERSDGLPLQVRNRVTLCRCGLSRMKPLCDGMHRFKNVVDE
jgi:CDGSH-type Zn-finger protein